MSNTQWVYGIHALGELLKRHPENVLELVFQQQRDDDRIRELKQLAENLGINWHSLSKKELDKRVEGNHQGVVASCKGVAKTLSETELMTRLETKQDSSLLLILDEITDPHNLGACLRTADAAGVDAVLIPKDKSAPLNMTVRKVASGAADTVTVIAVTNLSRTLEKLKKLGIWIVGAVGEAEMSLYEVDLTGSIAIVMGSEGKGLRRLTREKCDYLASIPMSGELSSLNVSVATGICLFEAVRQRKQPR